MSNEIKVGDKVRVREDAPKIFLLGWYGFIGNVVDIEDSCAKIECNDCTLVIPSKYLVKVDAEAFRLADVVSDSGLHQDNYLNEDKKEAKFKVGDKVVVHYPNSDRIGCIQEEMLDGTYDIDYGGGCTGHNITRSQIEPYVAPTIKAGDRVRNIESGLIGVVDMIVYGNVVWVNGVDGKRYHWKSDGLELVLPTEQTEAEEDARIRQMEAELDEFRKAELDRILHPEKPTFEVTIDNVVMNWQRYEADLAKEIAVKAANKFNDPKQAAEYAVSVAKAVVEGLKKK